ncbi:hypothetical protein M408DRAFT_327735 [Serendipita vermifera MAFF 305830]|uniref:Uncharacterized protein n=1 Tax=Serendipita vermifera MAFF 305830 TaxID=933852 RepID=A0A0C2XP43_SERVB|nr:hypothetical protein M408DRAFT_327735 [Serendipita vermifera MAFF 305830]
MIEETPSWSIARSCFQPSELLDKNNQFRLILGVKANGASEFLAPAHLTTRLLHDGKRLESASDPNSKFRSLSPVVFSNVDTLADTLGDHMNGKAGRLSKANKKYDLPTKGGRYMSQQESLRCQYERARTVFRHMASNLPYPAQLYGISPSLEDQGVFSEFLLFTYNDYKVGSEGGFLDAAWGFVDHDMLKENAGEAYRIKPCVNQDLDFQNEMFAQGRVRQTCKSVETLELGTPEDDRITIREHLRTCYKQGSRPVCIVVHDWDKAKDLLEEMHVDTRAWKTDIRSALQAIAPKSEFKRDLEDRKPYRDRSRSRSPTRGNQTGSSTLVKRENEAGIKRDPSPQPLRSGELQVYVLDTKALYSTMRRSGNLPVDLINTCRNFDLPEVEDVPSNQFCAGNEIRYLWALFIKIVDGPTIDEMYNTQFNDKTQTRMDDEEDEEDEEEGPSTGLIAPRSGPAAPQRKNPYDLLNEESDDASD